MEYIRSLVSGNKKCLCFGNTNLDLTYITPRLIAMAYPASGIESAYRNPINSVAGFLNTEHWNHYLIVNLSGRPYDYAKFNHQILEYDWLNHQAPPLNILFDICVRMKKFLLKDTENVICVNCLGGKGRTGTLICCFLLYTGQCKTVNDALNYYAKKRFVEGDGVTQPSQKRYINYFYQIINKEVKYPYSIQIEKILVVQLPSCYRGKNTLSIDLTLNYEKKLPIVNEGLEVISPNLSEVVLTPNNFNMTVCGDISFKIASTSMIKKTTIGRVVFNTAFISLKDERIVFPIDQVDPDRLVKDSTYPKGFGIKVIYRKVCSCQKDNTINESQCPTCAEANKNELNIWKEINDFSKEYKDKGSYEISLEGKQLLYGNNDNDVNLTLLNDNTINNEKEEKIDNDYNEINNATKQQTNEPSADINNKNIDDDKENECTSQCLIY